MRLVFVLLMAALLSYLVFGFYWERQLAPVMKGAEIKLTPRRLELKPAVSQRPIDLGFAEFDVPSTITGEPIQHSDTLFVSLKDDAVGPSSFTICPPIWDRDPHWESMLNDFAHLSGELRITLFEFRKRALYTKPFSAWMIPFTGVRRAKVEAVLLLVKSMENSRAERLEVYENGAFGVIAAWRPEFAELSLTDKRVGITQRFMFDADRIDPAELAYTLVNTYRFSSPEFDEAALLRRLRETGIVQHVPPQGPTLEEMQKTLDEINESLRNNPVILHRGSSGMR